MDIRVDNRLAGGEDKIRELAGLSGKALDEMWKDSWIAGGIGSSMNELIKEIDMAAGELRYANDRIVVVAAGPLGHMIRAGLAPLQAPGKKEVLVFGETLSAEDHRALLEGAERKNLAMIAVSCGQEPVAQCAAYACLKNLIRDKYGPEKFSEHIVFILPEDIDEDSYFGQESGEYPAKLRVLKADVHPAFAANTEAMLFPLMAAGADIRSYMDGFREMLASTWWDQDADRYSLYLAQHALSGGCEDVICWQRELHGLAQWVAAAHRAAGIDSRALFLPEDKEHLREGAFQTVVLVEQEKTDIMLPMFPGASAEGSMNEMVKEHARNAHEQGTLIAVEELNAHGLGQLTCFLQLSCGISKWILGNRGLQAD